MRKCLAKVEEGLNNMSATAPTTSKLSKQIFLNSSFHSDQRSSESHDVATFVSVVSFFHLIS